jgi:hypothetical protein
MSIQPCDVPVDSYGRALIARDIRCLNAKIHRADIVGMKLGSRDD